MVESSLVDRLTYFDIINNVIPGVVFFWALYAIGPITQDAIREALFDNTILDAILIIGLAYIVGHFLQAFSKYIVQCIVKWAFWRGQFYSEIFLIEMKEKGRDPELRRILDTARDRLDFKEEELQVLMIPGVWKDKEKRKAAIGISQALYRAVDARTKDAGLAKKAHLFNDHYAFYRILSSLFLLLFLIYLAAMLVDVLDRVWAVVAVILCFLALFLVFLCRAKERGEGYVKGLFYSYAGPVEKAGVGKAAPAGAKA